MINRLNRRQLRPPGRRWNQQIVRQKWWNFYFSLKFNIPQERDTPFLSFFYLLINPMAGAKSSSRPLNFCLFVSLIKRSDFSLSRVIKRCHEIVSLVRETKRKKKKQHRRVIKHVYQRAALNRRNTGKRKVLASDYEAVLAWLINGSPGCPFYSPVESVTPGEFLSLPVRSIERKKKNFNKKKKRTLRAL